MAKSPALVAKLKSFSDKLSGTSRVDYTKDPDSAASKQYKSQQMMQKPSSFSFATKQKTFGVPGAK